MSKAYTESDLLRQLRRQLASHSDAKPGPYQSQWQEALDQVVSQILSREEFSYDASADPSFKQYQDRYVTLGQRAMEDTLGRASALTGGYGNSHAQLAGQAAYNDRSCITWPFSATSFRGPCWGTGMTCWQGWRTPATAATGTAWSSGSRSAATSPAR